MSTRFPILLLTAACGALAGGCAPGGMDEAAAARLATLEDHEQIRQLLVEYGATLDRRDFTAFGALFATDAQYGGATAPVQGRAAIQAQLEGIIGSNPSGLPGPNFHLSFNPSITLNGDRATAVSLGAYTAPDAASGSTRLVFFVWYQDELVRQDGRWLFQRRTVGNGPLPAPASAPRIANPASEHCIDQGGRLEILKEESGEKGMCHLADGTVVEEWELFRRDNPQP